MKGKREIERERERERGKRTRVGNYWLSSLTGGKQRLTTRRFWRPIPVSVPMISDGPYIYYTRSGENPLSMVYTYTCIRSTCLDVGCIYIYIYIYEFCHSDDKRASISFSRKHITLHYAHRAHLFLFMLMIKLHTIPFGIAGPPLIYSRARRQEASLL